VTTFANLPPELLLPAAAGLPLLGALALAVPAWRRVLSHLIPWTALPALAAVGLLADGSSAVLRWVILQTRLGLDPTGRLFLLFTGALWLLAGAFGTSYLRADRHRSRFFFFYGLAMSGNLGAILAQDMVSFYVFFALMSFASYGLVVHTGEPNAVRAGRVYLYLVVMGEIFVFAALVLLAAAKGSTQLTDLYRPEGPSTATLALILLGFGIKAGALPLHVWLPLAHSAAPTPASAVLSGAMIKVGLLGWLRFIPVETAMSPAWGAACVTAGIAAAFYGVAIGSTQTHPKTILAYSSISQMGLITVGFGVSFWDPAAAAITLPAVALYAVHHGLAKGALFLGVGILSAVERESRASKIAWAGLGLAALSLAGAPFTSGAVSKAALKSSVELAPAAWQSALFVFLPLASMATTLLMGRLAFVLANARSAHSRAAPGMWLAWLLMVGMVSSTLLLLPSAQPARVLSFDAMGAASWPIAAGGALAALIWVGARSGVAPSLPVLPSGDMVVLYTAAVSACQRLAAAARAVFFIRIPELRARDASRAQRIELVRTIEFFIGRWPISGLLFLFLIFSFLLHFVM
jgi:formate hydrogenlyase subunit 3/multisubunit Na+/H+ antiporter MnhD subunit